MSTSNHHAGRRPSLADELPHRGCNDRCNRCGTQGTIDGDLDRWKELDGNGSPTRRVVLLCRTCADEVVDSHLRSYRRMQPNEAHPGSMPVCKLCRFRDRLDCINPDMQMNGGAGVQITFPKPTFAAISVGDRSRSAANFSANRFPKCGGFERAVT